MAEKQLSGLKVAAILTDGVEQVELLEPKKALENAGAKVSVISPKSGQLQGFKHHDKADKIPVDLELSKANPADFDAVLLPGGALNADALRIDKKAGCPILLRRSVFSSEARGWDRFNFC